MRADRFESWLVDCLQAAGGPEVTTFAAAGYAARPLGVVLALPSGASVYVQIVRGSPPDGSDRRDPEPIVTGEPAAVLPPVELPAPGSVRTADGEGWVRQADVVGWVAHAVSALGCAEISAVERYSTSRDLGSETQRYGVHVACHSGADIYLLFAHTLRAGNSPNSGNAFQQLESV